MIAPRLLGKHTTPARMDCLAVSRDTPARRRLHVLRGRRALAGGALCLVGGPLLVARVGVLARRHRQRGRVAAAADRSRRVARDVHDGVAQELAFIASHLQRLERTGADAAILTQIQIAAQRALLEARVAIELLRAPEDVPFEVLVERTAAVFRARFDVVVALDVAPALDVDSGRRTALLRILGQAMTNAIAHGGASHVAVQLQPREDGLSLRVHDDGCGFDEARTVPGWGLIGMRERAETLGGRVSIASLPGRGAAVEVTLP